MSIDHVEFRLLSEEEVVRLSILPILYPKPFVHGKIKEHGLHDLRLGATTQFDPCQTCHEGIETCNGHFGHITFTYPIYHALYLKNLVKILNCLCFSCFNLVIDIDQSSIVAQELKTKTKSNREMRKGQFEDLETNTVLDFLYAQSKHKSKCEQCGFPKHRIDLRKLDLRIVWKQTVKTAAATRSTTAKPTEPRQLFTSKVDQEYAALLMNHLDSAFILFCLRQLSSATREWMLGDLDPSCFVLMNLLVPPSITRPYTSQGKRVGLNELTVKLDEIVTANMTLFNQTDAVWHQFTQTILHKDFDCTQHPPEYVWLETVCKHNHLEPRVIDRVHRFAATGRRYADQDMTRSMAIKQYTYFWMIKRARYVTNKWMDQFALLKYQGSVFLDNSLRMHKPDKKTVRTNAFGKGVVQLLRGKYGRFRWNLLGKRVDQCARTVVVPEAYLEIDELGIPLFVAKQLTVPEIVMSYNRAKLQKLIIRGAASWPGANHVVKSDGSIIELELLSKAERTALANDLQLSDEVARHLQDGDICIFNRQPSLHRQSMMGHRVKVLPQTKGFALHECVTTTYNADFDGDEMNLHIPQTQEARAEVQQLMMVDDQMANHQNLGLSFGMKQNPLLGLFLLSSNDTWLTRDQVMNYAYVLGVVELPPPAIIKPQPLWTGRQLVSLACPPDFRYQRHDVFIGDGEWMTGTLTKKHLGTGEGQFFHVLLHQMGSKVTKRVFSNLHRLTAEFLLHRGFSVGLSDCFNQSDVTNQNKQNMLQVVEETIKKATTTSAISEHKTNYFLNTLLSFIQPSTRFDNRLDKMVESGSKGNPNNRAQIMGMLGQQNIDGKRIQKPFHPILKQDRSAKSCGLIGSSFLEGLDVESFYAHCAAGREGLVNTAVRTAMTGYSQRRLIKVLESIYITTDGFVRTTDQQIINVIYGDCNLNVTNLVSYRLKTNLSQTPDLMYRLRQMHYTHIHLALTQQTFLGQQLQKSQSKHVHDSFLRLDPIVIEIPFDIEFVWSQFTRDNPVDRNPQGMDMLDYFREWDQSSARSCTYRYFVLEVLLADWFGILDPNTKMPAHFYREDFMEYARTLYDSKYVEPGEAVGASGAESIGEPATQQTLNTFHYTGIMTQNITNGIPRLRELMAVNETVKTPLIYGYLLPGIRHDANRVARLEQFADTIVQRTVNYFCKHVSIVDQEIHIQFHHDRLIHHKLSPFVIAQYIRTVMVNGSIKVIKQSIPVSVDISFRSDANTGLIMILYCHPFQPETMQHVLQGMRTKWIISGVVGVEQAHVYRTYVDGPTAPVVERIQKLIGHEKIFSQPLEHIVSIAGTNEMSLLDVWDVYPIDFTRTFSNNIMEVQNRLGIDAAKYVLMKEMKASLSMDGSMVHDNHIQLLVDVMTSTGKLLPTDRNGLKMFAPGNILTRASFEKNMDVLRQAAMDRCDQAMTGVSEAIMVGTDLVLGTGASKMIGDMSDAQRTNTDTPRVFVTTSDWADFSDRPDARIWSEREWEPYFTLIHSIQKQCIDTCVQFARSYDVRSHDGRHEVQSQHTNRPQAPSTTQQPPMGALLPLGSDESVMSRKRKQNDIGIIHYRPSSPILLVDDSVGLSDGNDDIESSNTDDGNMSLELADGSTRANNESMLIPVSPNSVNATSVANPVASPSLTVDAISDLVKSLQSLHEQKHHEITNQTNHALALMRTLLTESLVSSFESES